MKTEWAAGGPANGQVSSIQAIIRRSLSLAVLLLMAAASAGFQPGPHFAQAATASLMVPAVTLTSTAPSSVSPALTPSPSGSPSPAVTPTPRHPAETTDVTGMILWGVALVLIIIGGTLRAMRPPSRSS